MRSLKMHYLVRTGRLKSVTRRKKSLELKKKLSTKLLPSKRECRVELSELTVNDEPVRELAELSVNGKPHRGFPQHIANDKLGRELPELTTPGEEYVNININEPEVTVDLKVPLKHGEELSSEAFGTQKKREELPNIDGSNVDRELLELAEDDEDNEVLPEFSVLDECPVEKPDADGIVKGSASVASRWTMEEQDELAGIKRMRLPLSKLAPDKIIIPDDWRAAADYIGDNAPSQQLTSEDCPAAPPIVVVCGVQNVGKTTFARFLVNNLLRSYKKVGYLDTDVGQPEFTPPGCLSLHIIDKPNPDLAVLCLRTPQRCYFYGDVSPKGDPEAYLHSIVNLYDYFRKEYYDLETSDEPEALKRVHIPLVVNTHGWVKGIGYDALVDMLRYMVPTHVVQIRLSTIRKNLPFGAFWSQDSDHQSSTKLVYLGTAMKDSMNKSIVIQKHGRQMRELRIIAYFRQCFTGSSEKMTTYKELACALASHPPYQVPIPSIKVVHLHCKVPDSEVYYSLNGTIVGLAMSSKACRQTRSDISQPVCVGIGIVRGIDVSKNLFYVITPVPLITLQKVDIFLQGFIEIPVSVLQTRGLICPYMSSNTVSKEGTGAASIQSSKHRDKKRDRMIHG